MLMDGGEYDKVIESKGDDQSGDNAVHRFLGAFVVETV